MKKLAILALTFFPLASWAWLNGGAENAGELQRILRLSKQKHFQSKCPIEIKETDALIRTIGRNVLHSETSCNPKETVEWDPTEDFPSIGLPHVVWFPPSLPAEKRVEESFPIFWKFLLTKYNNPHIDHADLRFPTDINPNHFPWTDKAAFDADRLAVGTTTAKKLADFLNDPMVLTWQSEYAIQRGLESAYKVLAAIALQTPDRSPKICKQLQKIMSTDIGVLSVVDYANFKGEGIDPKEVRGPKNVRWGLKQILERMDTVDISQKFQSETSDVEQQRFAAAALANLNDLANSEDNDRKPIRLSNLTTDGRGGWFNRIDSTYVKGGVPPEACPMAPFH